MSYPNSDMSVLQILVMALVMVAAMGVWLSLVFLAAREPRARRQQPSDQRGLQAEQPGPVSIAQPSPSPELEEQASGHERLAEPVGSPR
jgi:hypothetical protein